jgi:hypothetical protein
MRFFHGTSDKLIERITKSGLYDWMYRQPCWLSDNYRDAAFFAGLRVESENSSGSDITASSSGRPVVVEVDIPETLVTRLGPLGSYARKSLSPDRVISITQVSRNQFATKRQALYYPGFMGVMEASEFIQKATPEEVALFEELLDKGRVDEAWQMVESYLGLEHRDINEPGILVPAYRSGDLITLYASTDRDPTIYGIPEGTTLSTDKGDCRWVIAELRVPSYMLEEQDGTNPKISHYETMEHVGPRWVRSASWPNVRESFGKSFVSLPIWDIYATARDENERRVLTSSLNKGSIAPLSVFIGRATEGKVESHDLFDILSNCKLFLSEHSVTVTRSGSEVEKTLDLSVGDIVRDINTGTEGEIIAISKMHHEADIDIVVKWEEPINGQSIFEVHPNEIEFVKKKTEEETLQDIDHRYYDESIKENQKI